MVKRLNFAEAKALIDAEACVLLDVREEEEYITGHAVDAVLLPVDELNADTARDAIPDHDTPVLCYCRSGIRSRAAAQKLALLGYTRVYDLGSLIGWPYGLE